MVAFITALLASLVFSSSLASPIPEGLKLPPFDPRGLLCKIPIIRSTALCPRQGSSTTTISTPVGKATGTIDTSGATRFAVKYGSADRWKPSSVASVWGLPNDSQDPTALPLACPQPNADSSSFSEDCLSMLLYVPTNLNVNSNVPTIMWIHGGSFVIGSATDPGLDGSNLAIATNSIVAVVQYRLGALGWMAPDGTTNLPLKDIMTAMTFLQKVVPSFGGDPSSITLAGQSSGANMIRALLAVPSASSLFKSAIIQSDPMDYGFLSPSTQQTLQSSFNSDFSCNDASCYSSLAVSDILNAQNNLFAAAPSIAPPAGPAEPIRPVRDGEFITTALDATSSFPHQSKPLLISTVRNEAAPAIYSQFTDSLPESEFSAVVNVTFGSPRTQQITTSAHYAAPAPPPGTNAANVDARPQLEQLGTDYIWKCSAWTFARLWTGAGANAYVGYYTVGATYPDNSGIPICLQAGSVCHEDDIQIVFGTVPSPSSAQSALTKEMQARYASFVRTGSPNAPGLAQWEPATTGNVNPQMLGTEGTVPVGACDPGFWGDAVLYDYQVFGI